MSFSSRLFHKRSHSKSDEPFDGFDSRKRTQHTQASLDRIDQVLDEMANEPNHPIIAPMDRPFDFSRRSTDLQVHPPKTLEQEINALPPFDETFFHSHAHTPLQRAAALNQVEQMRALLENPAVDMRALLENAALEDIDVDNQYGTGITPLWFATRNGHVEAVRLLLGCGAGKHVESSYLGRSVGTPSFLATLQINPIPNHDAIVELFNSHREFVMYHPF